MSTKIIHSLISKIKKIKQNNNTELLNCEIALQTINLQMRNIKQQQQQRKHTVWDSFEFALNYIYKFSKRRAENIINHFH